MYGYGRVAHGTDIESGIVIYDNPFGGQRFIETLVGVGLVVTDDIGLGETIETAPFFFRVFAAREEQKANGEEQ